MLPGFDQSALVGEYDGLHPVAKSQLGEQIRDVGLDGALAYEEMRGELRVAPSGGEQLQDLGLSLGETSKLNFVAVMCRLADERFNDLPGDRGCEKRFTGSDDAHRVHEIFGRRVLE